MDVPNTLTLNTISFETKLQMESFVDLKYGNTDDMVADMFTKGLSGEQFKKLRQLAGLKPVS